MPEDPNILEQLGMQQGGGPSMPDVSTEPVATGAQVTPDNFEQMIIDQYKANNPDEIYKKKVKEYFDTLGVKEGTKKATLYKALSEMNRGIGAYQNGKSFVPIQDQLRGSADAEYKQNQPQLRMELSDVMKNQRERAEAASKERINKLKQDVLDKKNTQQGFIDNIVGQARAGDLISKAKTRDILTSERQKADAEATRLYGAQYTLMPKDEQAKFIEEQLKRTDPERYKNMIEATSEMADAKAPPSVNKALTKFAAPDFKRYLSEYTDVQKANKESKYAPVAGGGITLVKTMDQDTGNSQLTALQKNSLAPGTVISNAFDPNASKTIQNANLGLIQGKDAFNATMNMIKDGTADSVFGVGGGDPISTAFRNMSGEGPFSEEVLQKTGVKNLILQHARTMAGGGRFALQLAHDLQDLVGSNVRSPAAVAKGVGALYYSIDVMKAVAQGKLTPENSKDLMKKISKVIDDKINNARVSYTTKKNLDTELPSLGELMGWDKPASMPSARDAYLQKIGH